MKSIINGIIKEDALLEDWRKKGDIYEVLRIINDKPLFLDEHLQRMYKSDNSINIRLIKREILELIDSYDFLLNKNIFISYNIENKDRAIFVIEGFYPPQEWYENGISINTFQIKRINPNLKIFDIQYKNTIEYHLKKTGVFETIITYKGIVQEGSRSNVFFLKDNTIHTPSVDTVLPGITRNKVFLAANENNMQILETNIYLIDLQKYQGAFITGTSIDLLPINKIDNIIFNTTDSETFKKISKSFTEIKNRDLGVEDDK